MNAHMSHLMSKPGFATIFTIPTGMLNHLGNETKADQTMQMYRLSFPLVVRIWHKLVFWREIETPAHLRHCRDSSKVKSLHLGPAMSPESSAPRKPGIQMTCALRTQYLQPITNIAMLEANGRIMIYKTILKHISICKKIQWLV